VGAALVLLIGTTAAPVHGQKDAGGKDDAVREIDVKGVKLAPAPPGSTHTKPAKITTVAELGEVIPDGLARIQIATQVDFTEQYLLFFRWSGSGGDKLTPKVDAGTKAVVFQYQAGLTDDLRHHAHLYVIKKGFSWTVKN